MVDMEQRHWWGDFPFQLGQTRLWHIAGSELARRYYLGEDFSL